MFGTWLLGEIGRNDRGHEDHERSNRRPPSPLGSAAAMPNTAEFHVSPAQQKCIVAVSKESLVATLC